MCSRRGAETRRRIQKVMRPAALGLASPQGSATIVRSSKDNLSPGLNPSASPRLRANKPSSLRAFAPSRETRPPALDAITPLPYMPRLMPKPPPRTPARAAARLAAVQARYQHEMEGTAMPALLHEFHHHRLGATIEDVEYADADIDFFDDLVTGAHARQAEIDALIEGKLASGWTLARLDKPMKAILRAGTYELLARKDVPVGVVITEYLDVADAFYDKREKGFVNGLLDGIAKGVRG